MAIPDPVMNGTMTFLSIAFAFMVVTVFGRLIGCVSKDMTYVALVLYPLAAFCGWLLWCVIVVVVVAPQSGVARGF